jgi:hypothetical protein
MNSHMPFKVLTYSVPWLKEDKVIFFLHRLINDVNDEP